MNATDLVMPRMGATMTEGVIVRWLKQPGQAVLRDEPVLEIETDKSTVELTAPAAGVLGPWLAEVGQTVPIGRALVVIRPADGAEPAQPAEVRASPVAKRVARVHGIDLAALKGTGPGGRIVEEDVMRAVAAQGSPTIAEPQLLAVPSPDPVAAPAEIKRDPLSGLRRITAERMAQSFSTAPHFYLQVEVDAGALAAWLDRLNRPPVEAAITTYTDLLIKLTAAALRDHPRANARWDGDGVSFGLTVNLGLAVATAKGLVVPVLRRVEQCSLREVSRLRAELVSRAQAGKLLPDDYADGTFTLSNLGMYRVDSFQAILNPPQSAILAVGRIKPRPYVVAGALAVRPTLHLNLTADHRVLDGAEAAHFLDRLVELIETPSLLIE